jgi:hypothetical protein
MPRKSKINPNENNAKQKMLSQIYNDNFFAVNQSIKMLNNISKLINYDDKEDVEKYIPIVQKQLDILNESNNIMIKIQQEWT